MNRLLSYLLAVIATFMVLPTVTHAQDDKTLRGGWYFVDPFQYTDIANNKLTGLDVELLRAIARKAGYTVQFEEVAWKQHIEDISYGTRDVAAGAIKTLERENFAYFSIPYRQETNVLYLPKIHPIALNAKSATDLVAEFKSKKFRLGVIDGYKYTNQTINDFIADPKNHYQIIAVNNDYDNFQNLLDGKIDGFLADQIVASTVAWRHNIQRDVQAYPLSFTLDLHLMFSKATTSEEVVDAFNKAIISLKETREFNHIIKAYVFPILLSQTLDSKWFFIIDIIGTVAFVISGILLAYKHKYDIFGTFVLASLPAVGGGIIRDLLTNRTPIAVIDNPIYILIVIAVVVIGFIILKAINFHRDALHQLPVYKSPALRKTTNQVIQTCDALGLAAFTVTGVVVALATQSEPLWLWGPILATLTGAGGGILRDVVRSDPDIPALKGELYPEIALIWGGFLSVFLIWQSEQIEPTQILIGIIITMAGVFITRMLAIHLGWQSPRYY